MTEQIETRTELSVWPSALLTHNYWMRMLLVFALVAIVALSGALAYVVHENAHRKIPVVRIDSVGRPERFSDADYNYRPTQKEVRYFLAHFVRLYCSRRRATLKQDFLESLNFMDLNLSRKMMARESREKWIEAYASSGAPDITVGDILNVGFPSHWESRQPPYTIVVEFQAHKTQAGSEAGMDTVYATITFTADPSKGDDYTNPSGFMISEISQDKTLVPVQ